MSRATVYRRPTEPRPTNRTGAPECRRFPSHKGESRVGVLGGYLVGEDGADVLRGDPPLREPY